MSRKGFELRDSISRRSRG